MNDIKNLVWVPKIKEIDEERKWIETKLKTLSQQVLDELVQKAVKVTKNSYSPYSNYKVGVALLCTSGAVYASCNAEVASYSETDHGEESVITKAISEGEAVKSGRRFIEVLVVSHKSESGPCGRCRQIIAEHCDNALIFDIDLKGNIQRITSLKILFPYSFTPTHLGLT